MQTFLSRQFVVVICKRSHATPAPVLSTISIVTFVAALLVEADIIECGVKIVMSMPASCITGFIHVARVSLEPGLYGLDVVINKQVMLPLSDLVTSVYCLNSFIGQTFAFSWTGNCISPTWNLILVVFNLWSIPIIRIFSSIVVFRMSITDNISLPR